MNYNRLINSFLRRIGRRLLNRGIDAGIDIYAKRNRDCRADEADAPLTPEEKARANEARQMAKKARKAAKLARRISRFR